MIKRAYDRLAGAAKRRLAAAARRPLADEVAAQLFEIEIAPERPLILCDADEVLFEFVTPLQRFMERQGYRLTLNSYHLFRNVTRLGDGEIASRDEVSDLIRAFFKAETHKQNPAPGAVAALKSLSAKTQIVVVTNIPHAQREIRAKRLADLGMPYPVIANTGPKGAVVRHIAERMAAPTAFIDDAASHIASVAEAAPDVIRVHFIADPRIAKVAEPAEEADLFATDWRQARDFLARALNP